MLADSSEHTLLCRNISPRTYLERVVQKFS